jgi:cysteine-rich repeat protein
MTNADLLTAKCWDPPNPSPSNALPLCGNGVLDPGELCDDGNLIAGDGCNAFCSGYDAMAAPATLAGSTAHCPRGEPVVGYALSNTFFCSLRAIAAAPDNGGYVVLADRNTLLRYDLFTDATTGTITRLPASAEANMNAICSMAFIAPEHSLLIHDCGANRFFAAELDGTGVRQVADLSEVLRAPPTFKGYYHRSERLAVTAGLLVDPDKANGCIAVYTLTLANATRPSTAVSALLATIPCTIYGVHEEYTTRWSSMDVRGMQPHLLVRDRCPSAFRQSQWCYILHMQRAASLDRLRVYIPEEGGLDLQYHANTLNRFDNALGAPLIRYSQDQQLVYTLRGTCLQAESRLITSDGRSPPTVTLGNACKRAPRLGLECALPFNNPFITDVMTSPVLLPLGLSVHHTHAELTAIFNASCASLANMSNAGPLLYQSILESVYGNTTPVDFVELPRTRDIVYITPTSVGLISTKRILFTDRMQPGYVRATDLIYCPPNAFGSVGGVCHLCNNTAAPGYYVSIAWQIQCPRRARAGGISPPFETYTMIGSPEIDQPLLRASACLFAESRNVSCPDALTYTPPQVFNLNADQYAAADTLPDGGPSSSTDLIGCLIRAAETEWSVPLLRANPPEFLGRVISQGANLLQASAITQPTTPRYSNPATDQPRFASCKMAVSRGIADFTGCVVPQLTALVPAGRRRRLLQAGAVPVATAHHDLAVGSTTYVTYARTLPGADTASPISAPPSAKSQSSSEGDAFPIAIAAGVGVGGVVLVILLFCLFRNPSARRARRDD